MDMDDPWGSPWAEEQQPTISNNVIAKEGRPKTIISALESVPPLSPWGDDNEGFGDWDESQAPAEVKEDGLKLDGGNDTDGKWEKGEVGRVGNEHLYEPSQAWNEATPNSTPTLLPSPFETVRQPSPDPWAAAIPPHHIEIGGLDRNEDQHSEAFSASTAVAEHQDIDKGDITLTIDPERSRVSNDITINNILEGDGIANDLIPKKDNIIDESSETASPKAEDVLDNTVDAQEIDHELSRPSSSPSDHSHRDEIGGPESPRTSLDEPKRAQIPRQVSSKIQELVEHFDSLAKADVVDETVLIRDDILPKGAYLSPEVSLKNNAEEGNEDDDENDEFGEFEEGQSDVEDNEETQVPVLVLPSDSTPVPASLPKRELKKDFGRVEFKSNVSQLNKLFMGPEEEPQENIFIPDVVPHDSFTSIEERKTWYRISRYGTMQKHNAGDEENYSRVTWRKSQIRTDTLKIVARWMEEDRMSGGVVLGGTSKGSSLFGWNDPKSTPMSLESAFASNSKKNKPAQTGREVVPEIPREWPKGLVRSRSTSKTRSPSKPQRRSSTKSSKSSIEMKPESESKPQPSMFAWSASKSESKTQNSIPLAPQVAPITPTIALPPRKPASSTRAFIPPNIVVPVKPSEQRKAPGVNGISVLSPIVGTPTTATIPPAATDFVDDDDDWGEMVSTPATPIHPVVPTLQSPNLPHQTPKTLEVANSLNSTITSIPQPASSSSVPGSNTRKNIGEVLSLTNGAIISPLPDTLSSAFDPWGTNSTTPAINKFTNSMHQAFEPAVHPPASSNPDPWATADFSFFDAPVPKPITAPATKTMPQKAVSRGAAQGPLPRTVSGSILPKIAPQKTVVRDVPMQHPPQKPVSQPKSTPLRAVAYALPNSALPRGDGRTRLEVEQDNVVAGIVKSLPDLSYMLR